MRVKPPKPPLWFRLPFNVYSSSQLLQTNRCFHHCHLCLTCCWRYYYQQGAFAPPELPGFITTTHPSAISSSVQLISRVRGYKAYLATGDFSRGQWDFSSFLAIPCVHAATNTPSESKDASIRFRLHLLPSPNPKRFGLRNSHYEATYVFTHVTAWTLTHRTKYGFVDGLQPFDHSRGCHPSYRVLIITRAG